MKFRNRYGVRYPTVPGIVLDLPFSERSGSKVYDRSGKGNHGVIHNATWSISGKGAGLLFNSDNDYVDCGNDASLNIVDAITIEAWMKPSVLDTTQYWLHKGASCYYNYLSGATLVMNLKVGNSHRGVMCSLSSVNQWYHLVETYDKDISSPRHKLFVNGVLRNINPASIGTINSDAALFVIGRYAVGALVFGFRGVIALVKIYNRALSVEEVKRRYEQSEYGYLRST